MRGKTLRDRLLAKAVINWETGCWEWAGWRTGTGYGRIRVDGAPQRAHRVSYELLVGPIPEGLQLDHLCRVPICINPAHLEPVTSAENTRRAFTFARAVKTHCARGHEYTPENTRYYRGLRRCRACENARNRARHEAGKAAQS